MISSGMMIGSFFLKKSFSRGNEKIYNLNQKYEYIKEDDIVVSFTDVFEIIKLFCEENYLNSNDEKKMKTFSVKKDSVKEYNGDTYRALSFTVISGGYGLESDLTDSNTNKILFHRHAHIADNKKFNLLFFIPKDIEDTYVSKGIVIFQTIGTYGIKMHTIKKMKAFFINIGLTLETRSISVRTLIEKLIEQGNLYKITLIKNRISPNSADNMFINIGREEQSFIKPVLQSTWLQQLLFLFDGMSEDGIYEIDGDEFDDIKVQFKLGEHTRTVGLKNIDKFSIVEDFPETIYKNGRYDEQKLINYMIETANSYKEKMIFTVNNEG